MSTNVDLAADVAELFARVDACETRQHAIDMRQVRIERLLMELQGQTKRTDKKVDGLSDKISELVAAVLALAPKPLPPSA